ETLTRLNGRLSGKDPADRSALTLDPAFVRIALAECSARLSFQHACHFSTLVMNAPLKRCLVWFLWLASLLLAFQWGQRYPEELGKARSGETEGGSLAVTMPSGASPA